MLGNLLEFPFVVFPATKGDSRGEVRSCGTATGPLIFRFPRPAEDNCWFPYQCTVPIYLCRKQNTTYSYDKDRIAPAFYLLCTEEMRHHAWSDGADWI